MGCTTLEPDHSRIDYEKRNKMTQIIIQYLKADTFAENFIESINL